MIPYFREMKFDPQAKLTIQDVESSLEGRSALRLTAPAKKRLSMAHKRLQSLARSSEPIYGVNTGLGRLAQIRISDDELTELQVNLLRSHASGIGQPTSPRVVRRLMFLRALSLGKAYSGVSADLIGRHLDYLNRGLIPWIPLQGSVGASGDLAPLSHLGLTFMGEGHFLKGESNRESASSVLKRSKLKAISIGPKEGLALVNGTQFSLALALEARNKIWNLLDWLMLAICISVEGHRATRAVFDPRLHALKAHPHQRKIASLLWRALSGSKHMTSHDDCDLVQDAYSFRCIPQIMGPCLSLLERADELLTDEINSVSDNPVFLAKSGVFLSGGHFHAQGVGMAADVIAMAGTVLSNLVERRVDQLVNPLTTRTQGFLASRPGVESGLMIVQTAMASLASENKALSLPSSADTISTNGNQEDHVSMAPWGARKAMMIVENLQKLVAGELLCGIRACQLENKKLNADFAPVVEGALQYFEALNPRLFKLHDRTFGEDWRLLDESISTPCPLTWFEG